MAALKHRKLFPEQTGTNQSTPCLDFCDSTCPYNCYIYPESWIPPPPPPAPASPPPPALYTPDQNGSPGISPYVIITVGLVAGFFLLASYYAIIVKYCSVWRRRNHPPPSESDGGDEEDFLDENRGPQINHPIWFITTVGLQQAIINSITVCNYKRGEGLIEGTECSVCLSEFQEDETLRLLPKCNHAFHIPCIDTWLRSHTNCPLCRARIVADIVNPNPPLESTDQNSHNLGPNEQTQTENSGNDTELGSNPAGELQIPDDERTSKEGVNSNGDIILQVNGNSGEDDYPVDSGIQAVRRSVSVDSSSATTFFAGLADSHAGESNETMDGRNFDSGSVNPIAKTSKLREKGSPSIVQCLHKTPVSMKRSFSCGGRFFLPRNNRSPHAILPL